MKTPFQTTAPEKYKWDFGYGDGRISPSQIATQLFKGEIPGAMLCCYMLRRFGWPNEGSDDYKNLMSWCLTTPVEGLYLSVTPYLGARGDEKVDWKNKFGCSNLHFGIRFIKDIGRKIDVDAGREHWFRRHHRFIQSWWKKTGIKLYAWGCGLKIGDPDELVHHWTDHESDSKYIYGLYRRTASVKGKRGLPKQLMMVDWWLEKLIREKHPEVNLPKITKRERTIVANPFRRKCEQAIRVTMLDLLRPTNVRDISFTPFGDIEKEPEAMKRYKNQPAAGFWDGAGNTPEYYYSKEGIAERKKSK